MKKITLLFFCLFLISSCTGNNTQTTNDQTNNIVKTSIEVQENTKDSPEQKIEGDSQTDKLPTTPELPNDNSQLLQTLNISGIEYICGDHDEIDQALFREALGSEKNYPFLSKIGDNDNTYALIAVYDELGISSISHDFFKINCDKKTSDKIYSLESKGPYNAISLLGVNEDKIYYYKFFGDSIGSAIGENYVLDIKQKAIQPVLSYVNAFSGKEKQHKTGEGPVLFNPDFTKALKFQNLNRIYSYWGFEGQENNTQERFFLVTDITSKQTKIINTGDIDFEYVSPKYENIKWIDNSNIEIIFENGDKKLINTDDTLK